MTRRSFLSIAGAATVSAPLAPLPARRLQSRALTDPFELGVASGDPAPDGVVLWTRLAPRPLAEDGHGGLPRRDVHVQWQVAEDERFRRIVRAGRATARYADAGSVHVEVDGLRPGAEYFYRFRADGHLSPTGRTRTAPAQGALTPVTFAAASCANYEQGYFTAYRRLAEQHPDLVVHLGDYIYEGAAKDDDPMRIVRRHTGLSTCLTLADYRRRHAQYKSDPDLRAAHATAPWAVVWDDHELQNNWAGDSPEARERAFVARRRAAVRAYYENMPLRRSSLRGPGRIRLTRRIQWGDLAVFHMLDTRQFRNGQPCDDGLRLNCDARLNEKRVLLGDGQLRWLDQGLRASRARWNVLAQQVFLAQRDHRLGPGREMALDGWDGYAAERTRLMNALVSSGARNPVVLTGDVHVAHANDLLADFDDPDSAHVGVELVATSIASEGDGEPDPSTNAAIRAENPHIALIDQRRGYLLCRAAPGEMTADFHAVPYVTRRGAPVSSAVQFTVHDGARSLGRPA
ncbi:alkaline phosphatase D family protein [Actinomadura miaoliensis]|uniref:Alkaline phosphatase D family protein n=1 Tax=Actinomadura miaoliensis TaxID=430685 RepID=A0ABP7X6F8_9ACTN